MRRFTEKRLKDVTWYVPIGQEALLEGLEGLVKFHEGAGVTVLKKGRRKSFALLETTVNGGEVYVKTFRVKGILQRLKHQFLKSKALRELEVSLVAQERGIPVVLPLAAGEKYQGGLLQESYLLIQRLPGALNLLEYLCTRDTTHRDKARVIEALGRLSRKTHDEGILQEDFALNNFLLANPQDSQIFLIDFERSRVSQTLSTEEKEWTLAKLNRIGADFTLTYKFRFLKAYCRTKEEFRDLPRWKRLEAYTHQILKRDAQRISNACVRDDRGYKSYKDARLTCYFLEGYHLEELLALAPTRQEIQEGHRGQFNVSWYTAKIKKGTAVETVRVCKFYSQQKGIPLATAAWRGANGLRKAYFPVSPPVAAIEWTQDKGYKGVLLFKELEGVEDIRDVLQRCPQSAQRRYSILWYVARFLSRLHNFGTFAYSVSPGDISLVKDRTGVYKPFLTRPYNFLVKKCLERGHRDREMDMQRLEDYLQGILTQGERDYLRGQYLQYTGIIS